MKSLILGVARTGAKFTPHNHKLTGDRSFDAISSGDQIEVKYPAVKAEIERLYDMDVRYFHEHARNSETREQTADLGTYAKFSHMVQDVAPDALLSFGGSRNGPEIARIIEDKGETARIAQAGLSRKDGGADFVTTQAAIELQIVTDMERQGLVRIEPDETFKVLGDLSAYTPSGSYEEAELAVHSTAGGANYGSSSAWVQMETLRWSIDARRALGLPYEVEWVQAGRSSFLTWYMANFMPMGLRELGRLNVTVLYGFSQKNRFPTNYQEFLTMVKRASAIAVPVDGGDQRPLDVSVSVGAAVLPQHAEQHRRPMDVGPMTGRMLGPMERLAAYASQPDSGVDILRVGLEDTPYSVDPMGKVLPTTNAELVARARDVMSANGARPVLDAEVLKKFRG